MRNNATIVSDRSYLARLIQQGEHQQQDFKYKVQDARKLARSVSAFANTDGGRLLIGVRDDGHLSGVRSEEEIYMMHQAAFKYCQPNASIKFDTYNVYGRTIVVCTVSPSDRKPVFAIDYDDKPKAYIRIADENIVASPVHLAVWREESSPKGRIMEYSDNEHKLMDTLKRQQWQTLNQIVRRSGLNRRRAVSIIAQLVRFRLVRWRFHDQCFAFGLSGE
ncbi:MAG: putative DNA binding domain-containing protein [Prevotella sp.]|nr:putative DNA binding domain-containing protein [Prevotella sp.]